MTATHNAGPTFTFGSLPGSAGSNPEAGPNGDYQGSSVIDVRYPFNPGQTGKGHIVGSVNYPYGYNCDSVPSVKNASIVAAAQAPVVPAGGSVAMTLASTNQISPTTNGNRAVNIPVVPFGSTMKPSNAVSCLALDPGHTTGTTTSGSATVASVGDIRLITPGQYVCIPGGLTSTTALIARVISKTASASTGNGNGSIVLDTAAGNSVSNAPIMLMEYRPPNDNTGGASVVPYYYAGAVALMDPYPVPGRVLTVTSNNAGDTGYSISISGYDIFNVPMRETIAVTANATATGKKAWKYITGINLLKTGGGTPAGTISVGTSDTFGFSIKSEKWEYMQVYFAGAFVSTNTGWTAADSTTPATATTGDVRGTYALQSPSTGLAATGVLTLALSYPARQLMSATWADPTPLYGVTQF